MEQIGKRFLRILSLVLGVVILSSGAWAQGNATLLGTVTDQSGAAVPNAKITITNTENGFVRNTETNSTGNYTARDLGIGQYTVRVEAPTFKTYEKTGITLSVNDVIRADASLQVGGAQESITVEAAAIQVQSESNDVSQTITSGQVSQLATNGRNVLQLTALVPGAASSMPDFDSPVAQFQNRSVYFNGQRQDHNNWIIDGGEAYDRGGGGILIVSPSQDAIQEFKVTTSNFAADLGNSSGGMITMAMKQGSRTYHGSVFYNGRNDVLNAFSYMSKYNNPDPKKPVMKYNTFGFNLGGPIKPKSSDPKSFFFYNQEWRRLISAGAGSFYQVPDSAAYNGDLSNMCANSLCTIHVPSGITDPAAIAKFASFGLNPGDPFPNNTIPAGLIDPNAKAFLSTGIFPQSNTSDGTHYFSSPSTRTFYREEAVRLDHQFNDKFTLMGHLIWDSGTQELPTPLWSGTTFPTVGSNETVPSWAGVVHATYTISPTLLNEASFNLNGNNITIVPSGNWQKPDGWTVPQYFSGNNPNNKLARIGISGAPFGFTYDPGSWPWSNTWRSYQYKDDVSWSRGRHNVKFGAAWLHTQKNQQIFGSVGGNFNFNGDASGAGLADFLLGYAQNYSELQLQDFVHIVFNQFNLYALDDWHATKRLTLNLGLRWEGMPHAYDKDSRLANFYPGLYDPAQAAHFLPDNSLDPTGPGFTTVSGTPLSDVPFYLNGVGIAGKNGIPKGLVDNHWNIFAPRIGFAYDLLGNGATVLRGGFGMFYERTGGNEEYNMGGNPPFSFSGGANNVYLSNPAVSYVTGAQASGSPRFPAGFTGVDSRYPIPTTMQWNFGIQHQLRSNTVLSVAYVGNGSYHQTQTLNINLPAQNDPIRQQICGSDCGWSGAKAEPNLHRPYLGWGDINIVSNSGNSNYNSLQTSLRAQLKDFTLNGAYTYSHAFNVIDGDLFNNVSNPFDPGYDYASAGFDRRHVAVFSYIWNLPFLRNSGNHFSKSVLGGWTISGVTLFESGTPLTINASQNLLGFGGGGVTNHADLNGSITYPETFDHWFSGNFTNPAPLTWGNAPRNVVRGPGRNNTNLALYKDFKITERVGFQFRAESFNTFNHTQFSSVNTSVGSGDFGKVNGTADPRVFQLGAKLSF